MILFSRKIKCVNCGRGFKAKKERKKRIYVCGGYDNYAICKREAISQKMLLELLDRRFGRRLSAEEIKNNVKLIEVENVNKFTIYIRDQKPIVFGDNFIQF